MMLVQAQAYRTQYGFDAIYLLPINLYRRRDNFGLESPHVIPAMIRKCVEAKEQKAVCPENHYEKSPYHRYSRTRWFLLAGTVARKGIRTSQHKPLLSTFTI